MFSLHVDMMENLYIVCKSCICIIIYSSVFRKNSIYCLQNLSMFCFNSALEYCEAILELFIFDCVTLVTEMQEAYLCSEEFVHGIGEGLNGQGT